MKIVIQRQKHIISEALLALRDMGEISQSQVKEINDFINNRCVENLPIKIAEVGSGYEPAISAEKPRTGFHGVKF